MKIIRIWCKLRSEVFAQNSLYVCGADFDLMDPDTRIWKIKDFDLMDPDTRIWKIKDFDLKYVVNEK